MQVTETVSEGLKREFKVVVPAADLATKADAKIDQLKDQVRINGFRPGKVPVAHLKRLYGRAVMAEMIETAVREANAQIVTDRGFKLVREPQVTLPTEQGAVEQVIEGKSDLAYTVAVEILPPIELADFKGIVLERLSAEVNETDVDEALKRITEQSRPFAAKGEGAKAENGDRVTIDFTGKMEGVPFEGGTGGDVALNLGSGTFIPGFEDQLIGVAAGEQRTVTVTFPQTYPAANLAGKNAEFDVTVKSVDAPQAVTLDDEYAKTLGLESLAKLREMVKGRLAQEHGAMSRQKVKRQLLDELDAKHKFGPPPSLVEDEFANVWKTIADDLQSRKRTFEEEGTTEEKAKEEYRGIAERRVRLGLVIAEIGERNNIKVSDEELSRAVMDRARQVPGREQEVWDFYRNNPDALASLRAPIFEDKVVDYILELAKITDKTVTREELYKEDED
ncbi:MAG: trigger factor [Alphaproteobacteria bacterium]|nr:trigger factor [Alphaproteobacteria bacterium]